MFDATGVATEVAARVLDDLDAEQRRAVTHPPGPLLVLAGAGTGKTKTLVARAAWLCQQGLEPSRILLLTFTRRAADEMLARVSSSNGTSGIGTVSHGSADDRAGGSSGGRITGGTFHSIAHRIIRRHAESFSLPAQFSVIDPGDVIDLFDLLRNDYGLTASERRAPRAATCADIYARCVNTQAPVAEVVKAGFGWCSDATSQLSDLFRGYVAHKRAHGLVDFDDMLLMWRAALADEAAGPALRGMFDAVLVDEYQDVNAIQADIVRLLRPEGDGLTCVGDDAQAIYGFRGADPAHLRELTLRVPGIEVVRLTTNYRSKPTLLALSNAVRPQSAGLELTLRASRVAGLMPLLIRCYDEATQAREICAKILEGHEAGTDLRDQAVLVRSAHHSDVLEIELAARGIPFVKYGGLRFTEAAHVRDFLAALRVITNPADDVAWFRLLRLHDGIGPAHAARLVAALRLTEPLPISRWSEAIAAAPARSRPALTTTLAGIEAAARLHDAPLASGSTIGLAMAVLTALDDALRGRYPNADERIADLERLADAAVSRPSLHDALVDLALDPPVSASDLAGPPRIDEDYLTISTIHSAKGLEWPVVHLAHLVDGAVPSDLALTSRAGLDEERRLFYVAVTRARDQLFLYSPLRLHHHRRGRDDRHSLGQLTRFLDRTALAACHLADATPPEPSVPRISKLTATIDASLDALWSG
ncbi:MAG TPA: ATP-dependent helicase [Streptosporangiaceae bacterium]|nr:ATP-dependent helicase [Streptosporangiaceae bacterium]